MIFTLSTIFPLIIINLILSSFISIIFIPKIIVLGNKFNIVDQPDKRRLNLYPKIRIGGFAILMGFFGSVVCSIFLFNYQNFEINIIFNLLISAFYFFLIGFLDDIFNLKPLLRLIFQFLGAFFIYSNIVTINSTGISLLDKFADNLPVFWTFLTVIWIVGITNAFNWLDGIDGLAAGISMIISLGTFAFGVMNGSGIIIILSTSLIGSCLGFMKYNFYPSKIMMGDGGSYFLGVMVSILSLICIQSPIPNIINANKLFLSFLLLGLPILDMIYVILIRLYKGSSPFKPDNNHIHHRLINNKISQKSSVFVIYSLTNFFVSIVALFNFGIIGLFWFLFALILLIMVFKKISIFYIFKNHTLNPD